MSIYSALNVGVSGLQAQSNKIGVLSDNVANASTVGYKAGVASFATLMGTVGTLDYSPGGVMGGNVQLNGLQGELTPTASPTDLAIAGTGFFAIKQNTADTSVLFTRAGSFTQDKSGNFINGAGFYLQGWPLDADGELSPSLTSTTLSASTAIAALQTVNVTQFNTTAVPTSTIGIQTNLNATQAAYNPGPPYNASSITANMASGSVPPHATETVQVTDNLSVTHNLTIGYLKTGTNTWSVEVYAVPASDVTAAGGQLATGTLTFNSNNVLTAVSSGLASITIDWTGAATDNVLTHNWLTSSQTLNQGQAIYDPPVIYNAASSTASMASGSVPPHFTQPLTVVDSLGAVHSFNVGYLKTAANSWAVEVYADPAADVTATDGQVARGTLAFNADGTLQSVSPALSTIPVTWTGGAAASSLAVDWGTAGPIFGTPLATVIGLADGLSQVAGGFNVGNVAHNGIAPNTFKNLLITSEGYVTATYSDGQTRNLYKIPLVAFSDPNQLSSKSSNVFAESVESGSGTFLQAGTSGAGTLQAGALEASNVDIAGQLTDMIIAQRAYQANTKTITTTDSMLQTLGDMVR